MHTPNHTNTEICEFWGTQKIGKSWGATWFFIKFSTSGIPGAPLGTKMVQRPSPRASGTPPNPILDWFWINFCVIFCCFFCCVWIAVWHLSRTHNTTTRHNKQRTTLNEKQRTRNRKPRTENREQRTKTKAARWRRWPAGQLDIYIYIFIYNIYTS